MKIRSIVAAFLLLTALTANVRAQTYTIKLKSYPDTGMTVTYRETLKETGSSKLFDADGKLVQEKTPPGEEKVYTLTVLEKAKSDGLPVKYLRTYEKLLVTEDGKTRTLPYQGRTILFEKKDDTFRVGVAGKPPLEEKDLESLIGKANKGDKDAAFEKALTPAKIVTVGERWTVDPNTLGGLLEGWELDAKASRGDATLVKVYKKGNSQFGVIALELKLVIKSPAPGVTFDPPGAMDAKITFDAAIDGSSTARTETVTAKITCKGIAQQGPKNAKVEIDIGVSGTSERSEEKDDAKAREVPVVEFSTPGGNWTEFVSKEGRFTASFPGKPEVTTKEAKGKVTTTTAVKLEQGKIIYTVVYTDFPATGPKLETKAVLAGIVEAFAKNTKEKKDIKLNGHEGIEFVCELDQGGEKVVLVFQVFHIDNRLYQPMVAYAPDLKEKVEIRKFLDSFKLHDKKEEKPPEKGEKK